MFNLSLSHSWLYEKKFSYSDYYSWGPNGPRVPDNINIFNMPHLTCPINNFMTSATLAEVCDVLSGYRCVVFCAMQVTV